MDPIFVEIVTSPNCVHSPKALRLAKRIIAKVKNAQVVMREVSVSTEEGARRAQEFEVRATPAIAINGRVAFVGVPTEEMMEGAIQETIARLRDRDRYFF